MNKALLIYIFSIFALKQKICYNQNVLFMFNIKSSNFNNALYHIRKKFIWFQKLVPQLFEQNKMIDYIRQNYGFFHKYGTFIYHNQIIKRS